MNGCCVQRSLYPQNSSQSVASACCVYQKLAPDSFCTQDSCSLHRVPESDFLCSVYFGELWRSGGVLGFIGSGWRGETNIATKSNTTFTVDSNQEIVNKYNI